MRQRERKLTPSFPKSDLSARLNLTPEEGEKWIVNLIRDTRMAADAKIDLEKASFHSPFYTDPF